MSANLADIGGTALSRYLSSSYADSGAVEIPGAKMSRGRIKIWLLLALAFVAGIILVVVSKSIQWDFGIIHEIGVGLIVAAVLGVTIDFALKSAIARDVFEATLGHILRPEFRNEVARITGYKFICESHILKIDVQMRPGNTVEVTTSIERTIKNISAYSEKRTAFLHIDDWGFPDGPSEIQDCKIIFRGETTRGASVPTEPFRVKWESREIEIPAGETFTAFSKLKEFRRDNDSVNFNFSAPTTNPEIEVNLPPELDCTISFGGPDKVHEFQYARRARLQGVYFPHQSMIVRWWPKR